MLLQPFTIRCNQKRNKLVPTCLGSPYNHSFYPKANGGYCSELITYVFKTDDGENYFILYPMSFNYLTSWQILPYWIDYYCSLNQSVTQGELGSHPPTTIHTTTFIQDSPNT